MSYIYSVWLLLDHGQPFPNSVREELPTSRWQERTSGREGLSIWMVPEAIVKILLRKLTVVAPRQHDSAAILQLNAVAAHAVPQQFLHAAQPANLEFDLIKLLSSQAPPARRSWGIFPKAMKQHPDFRNGEACASNGCNYGQVEFGIGREVPLAALAGSRRQDSGFFVKTNGRGADSCFSRKFADFHVAC